MSFSAIWHRRLKYFLTPQFDLYARIADKYCDWTRGHGPILDYGCGSGFGTARMVHRGAGAPLVYGVDRDREAIDFASQVHGNVAEFFLADAIGSVADNDLNDRWIRFRSFKEFAIVTLIEVVEHMHQHDQSRLCGELCSVMGTSGTLILATPNKHSQFRKHGGHVGMHDPASLRDLLAPHFESVAFEDYLGEPLADDTAVSPLVAICRGPK